MAIRTIHSRFYYPSLCEDCKRIPLIHISYESRFNVGYEWEDSMTYTTCPVCLVKGKIKSLIYRLKEQGKVFSKYALPAFFAMFKTTKSFTKSWKIAKLIMLN